MACAVLCGAMLAGCVDDMPHAGRESGDAAVRFDVSLSDRGTRAEGEYDALATSTLRIYRAEDDGLIRKYSPVSEIPEEVYLAAGGYRVTVEAGDGSAATFTNKSYAGEASVTLEAHDVKPVPVVCRITNIAVQVVFDATVAENFGEDYSVRVVAADSYGDAAEDAPALEYTQDDTGYFLLPEGVTNLSWGFEGQGIDDMVGNVVRDGVISAPEGGMLYTLTFRYSPDADGFLSVNVQVREYESVHDDDFTFSPQPTVTGSGFDIASVTPYNGEPIRFEVSSINTLSSLSFTTGGTRYDVLSGGEPDGALAGSGITYTPNDGFGGVLELGTAFMEKLPAGVNAIEFELSDADAVGGEATARVAVPGPMGIVSSDLWFGRGTLGATVTESEVSSVVIRYRESDSSDWTDVTASKGDGDYYYDIDVEELKAGRTYEFMLLVNGSECGSTVRATTQEGVQIPGAGFEEWHQSGSAWFPYAAGGPAFWGTGNEGATTLGEQYNLTTGVEEPRPGSAGTTAARLETKKPSIVGIGRLAAGNLFVGEFGGVSGMGGTVHMGRAFDFNARPTALKLWYKYTPQGGDKGRIFVCFANMADGRTYHVVDTNNADATTFLPDDEFLYTDKGNPSTLEGHVIAYGDLMLEQTVGEWTEVTIPITYREKYAGEKPNVLILTAAASYRGDYFEGEVGSTMYLDDVEFVY